MLFPTISFVSIRLSVPTKRRNPQYFPEPFPTDQPNLRIISQSTCLGINPARVTDRAAEPHRPSAKTLARACRWRNGPLRPMGTPRAQTPSHLQGKLPSSRAFTRPHRTHDPRQVQQPLAAIPPHAEGPRPSQLKPIPPFGFPYPPDRLRKIIQFSNPAPPRLAIVSSRPSNLGTCKSA